MIKHNISCGLSRSINCIQTYNSISATHAGDVAAVWRGLLENVYTVIHTSVNEVYEKLIEVVISTAKIYNMIHTYHHKCK